MTLTYSDGWDRHHNCPGEPWNAEKARKAHEARELYAVAIGPADQPTAYIEFNIGYAGLALLDEMGREPMVYVFDEQEPGRLFLQEVKSREFVGDTDEVEDATIYGFYPEGRMVIQECDVQTEMAVDREGMTDVSENWEPYPEFGEYESLLRVPERIELDPSRRHE